MPYNRRYRKKRKPQGRPWGRYMDTASKALKVALTVKKLLNVEFKRFDVSATAQAQTTTVTILQVSNILLGDGGLSRDGNQIKITGIYLNYLWTIHASATTTQVRVMLVQDSQTNGAIYAASDLLVDQTGTDNIISPYNLDNKYRFRVLFDRTHVLNDNGNQSVIVNKFIKLDQRMRFDASAGDITDVTSMSYSLVFVSSEATNTPARTHHCRIRFIDN